MPSGEAKAQGIVARALAAAEAHAPPGMWRLLSRRERTHAIYLEMRRIDLEETHERKPAGPAPE